METIKCTLHFNNKTDYPFKFEDLAKMFKWLEDPRNMDKIFSVEIGGIEFTPMSKTLMEDLRETLLD